MADTLQTMRLRYGDIDVGTPLTRLQMKQRRNLARREAIRLEMETLLAEERRLALEYDRMEQVGRQLVEEVTDQIRRNHGEAWSPTPLVGYRLWAIEDDRVIGATGHVWDDISQDARCARSRPTDDLPHTDHVCSSVGHGCGIYAAADPSALPWPGASGYVAGVVLLSGKVVEHEHGFRAAHARVASAIAYDAGRVMITKREDRLSSLFGDPLATLATYGEQCHPPTAEELKRQMQRLGEEIRPWT